MPEWVPGAGFKRLAREWANITSEFYDKPFAFVKQQMAAGVNVPSYVSALLEQENLSADEEDIIKWTSQSLYAGGSETVRLARHSICPVED